MTQEPSADSGRKLQIMANNEEIEAIRKENEKLKLRTMSLEELIKKENSQNNNKTQEKEKPKNINEKTLRAGGVNKSHNDFSIRAELRMDTEQDNTTTNREINDIQSLWITTWCSSDLRHRASQVTSGLHQTQQQQLQQKSFGGQKFSETPFMNASDMDDMLFECKNNAIYVLNTNYAYGEFGRLNLFGASTINNTFCEPRNGALGPPTSLRNAPPNYTNNNYNNNLFRSSSANLVNSNHIAEVPHISVTERTSSTTTAASVSTRTIPKLFHYSPNEHSDHLLQNHIPNPHHQHLHHIASYESHQEQIPFAKSLNVTSPAAVATGTATTISSSSKKTSNLKSAIIAKKTKFWKYLEEEKWKKSTSIGNLTTTNCERNSDSCSLMKNNGVMINNTSNHTNNAIRQTNNNNNNSSNNNNNNGGRNKSAGDSSNQKSSTELYKEAAELLGLSCTLCDNCRCLDCQSRYFECDDSDSYSELSFLGDYFDAYDIQPQNTRHSQDYNGSNNAAECRSLQSDNSSICSVNSNHSDSP